MCVNIVVIPILSALFAVGYCAPNHNGSFVTALENFGRNTEFKMKAFENLGIHQKYPTKFGRLQDESDICVGCVDAINLLYVAMDLGFEYDDIRDILIDVCEDLFNSTGQRGDIICTPVLDHYGNEVTYILRTKAADGEEVCIGLNMCDPDDTPGQAEMPKITYKSPNVNREPWTTEELRSNTIRVVHLTDVHLEEAYLEGSVTDCGLPVCCRGETPGNGTASKWGDYHCNTPPRTLELFLERIRALNPDFVIYTGDNPPHAQWTESREGQLAASRWVAGAIGRILGEYQVFPNIGNHESHPTNLYYLERNLTKELNNEFAAMWKDAARFGPDEMNSIRESGYYQMEVRPGLRIITYNTNYGYVGNFYTLLDGNDQALAAMRTWMLETLTAAREAGEKVILSGHHPVGRFDMSPLFGRTLSQLCVSFSDIIVLHVIGHTHKDEFVLFTDTETTSAVGLQHVAPATTGMTNVNPSMRVFTLNGESFQPVNYEQYQMDLLKAAELEDEPDIELVYNAIEEYNLPDMSPGSWAQLLERFETEEGLFDKYLFNRYTGNADAIAACDEDCRKEELCEIRYSSWDQVRICLKN